ncbi:MAG: adenylate/guanylate cyclase domain-containing protein [Patescibacteria group bacterium]
MKQSKKIGFGLSVTLLISLLMTGVNAMEFLKLEDTERNFSAHLYQERELSDEIVIVAIDEKSISTPETGGLDRYSSWNRGYYAQALENIQKEAPTAVFFDVLFSTETDGLSSEEIYAIAKEYPKIEDFTEKILNYLDPPHPIDQTFADVLSRYENVYFLKSMQAEQGWDNESQAMIYSGSVEPASIFADQVKTALARVTVSEESTNSSMIFSIPRYYRESASSDREQQIDFQLTEEHLGRPLSDEEIPLKDGQMLINYAGKPYSFPSFSFSDVYYGRVDPSEFEGKIVLIGATAAIMQDRHFTPIDATAPMPGVEIHANALQTLLEESYLKDQGSSDFFVQTFISLSLASFVALFTPLWIGMGAVFLLILAFPFYAQMRFDQGTIVSLILPPLSLIAAYVAVLVYRNVTEFAEKRKLKMAFSRYVSPELAEEITEKPDMLKLGGERKNITALFLDVENFTTLSEGLEPQEVVRVINVYFDGLAQVIMGHGGSVDKYEGDAIMALFGAPVPSTDHAVKACFAAMAIQARMKELNAQMGYNLNIRIGLATGDAIVGNMGSSQRFDYTAMGDTVNTASRLEGANKFYKTGILVNPGTFEAAQDQIFFRKIDTVCLKGKENAIGIYQVLGTQEGATPDGKAVLAEWQSALEDYKAANWDEAEKKIRSVLTKLPEDGPAKTFLGRIAELKLLYKQEQTGTPGLRPVWDGIWRFESK